MFALRSLPFNVYKEKVTLVICFITMTVAKVQHWILNKISNDVTVFWGFFVRRKSYVMRLCYLETGPEKKLT